MPLLPASLIEPLWVEFAVLIGSDQHPEFVPSHPWGCHRPRIPDRVVFDHLIAALVHGSGYERIATTGCSDRTLRRRLRAWAQAGHGPTLLRICLTAYDRMIGLDLHDLASYVAGRVHHHGPLRKRGRRSQPGRPGQTGHETVGGQRGQWDPTTPGRRPGQRSRLTAAGTDPGRRRRHDRPATAIPRPARRRRVPTVHLDRGYDSGKTRDMVDTVGRRRQTGRWRSVNAAPCAMALQLREALLGATAHRPPHAATRAAARITPRPTSPGRPAASRAPDSAWAHRGR